MISADERVMESINICSLWSTINAQIAQFSDANRKQVFVIDVGRRNPQFSMRSPRRVVREYAYVGFQFRNLAGDSTRRTRPQQLYSSIINMFDCPFALAVADAVAPSKVEVDPRHFALFHHECQHIRNVVDLLASVPAKPD